MKSQVTPYFDEWLALMERAFEALSFKEFVELENKIKHEIAYRRKRKKAN